MIKNDQNKEDIRIKRLVFAISIVGSIISSIQILGGKLIGLLNTIYISGEPLNIVQILGAIFMASEIIIAGIFIYYIYRESFTLINFGDKQGSFEMARNLSDDSYYFALHSTKIMLTIIFVVLAGYGFLQEYSNIFFVRIEVYVSLLAVFPLFVIRLVWNTSQIKIVKLIKDVFLYFISYKGFLLIFVWLILSTTIVAIGLEINSKSNATFYVHFYDKPNKFLQFSIQNTEDVLESLTVKIGSISNNSIILHTTHVKNILISGMSAPTVYKPHTTPSVVGSNLYTYSGTFQLGRYFNSGIDQIIVTLKMSNGADIKKYVLFNEVFVRNKDIKYANNSLSCSV